MLAGIRLRDQITLVMAYCEHIPFREYYLDMKSAEIKDYFRVLISFSLDVLHNMTMQGFAACTSTSP